jgi:hypothetical protein
MNYAELTELIQDTTENRDLTFVANIPNFIQDAERRIYTEVQLPQFRKTAPLALVTGVYVQPMPSDFLRPASVLMTVSGEPRYLDLKEYEYARLAFSGQGAPRVYAFRDDTQELIVAPAPAAAYPAEITYYFYPESIVTAGTTWLSENFSNVLLYGSLIQAYIFMKGEADVMQAYVESYRAALGLMQKHVALQQNDNYRQGAR